MRKVIFIVLVIHLFFPIMGRALELNLENQKPNEKIKGYFNNDSLEDYITIDKKTSDVVYYSIYLNLGKNYVKTVSFEVSNDTFDGIENALENSFISNPKKGELLIGTSCCGSLKQTETNYYKYFDECKNWIFYKTITSVVEEDRVPKIELSYSDYLYTIDNKKNNSNNLSKKESTNRRIEKQSYLDSLYNKLKTATNNKTINKIDVNLNFDDLAELLYVIPINDKNINKYNDLAYYLSQTKNGKTNAIFLLKSIIKNNETRVVAYLNIADVQWDTERKNDAKKSYQKYISLMKSQKKDLSKIPSRVNERIK